MMSEYISGITGLGTYPTIGLIIFLAVFSMVLLTLIRTGKKHCRMMSSLPLIDDSTEYNNEGSNG